jgi:pimeloyl-ACP methyl ester carboxylesterase
MSDPLFIEAGDPPTRIAYRREEGDGPEIVWLGGFRSDMVATKASHLADWARRQGRAFTRFDYAGHGESAGRFEDGTISRWLGDAFAVIERVVRHRPLLVGSSMGGWLSLLAARRFAAEGRPLAGLVLIAPAPDFTERLMWDAFPEVIRTQIMAEGYWPRPSQYGDPVPITRALIEDGRHHLLLDGPLHISAPVHILQGMADEDVPWQHAMRLVERLPQDDVTMTLIKDGDHRLSRPQDLDRLVDAIEGMIRSGAE